MFSKHVNVQETHLGNIIEVKRNDVKADFTTRNIVLGHKRPFKEDCGDSATTSATRRSQFLPLHEDSLHSLYAIKRRRITNAIIPHGIGPSIPLKKASWWRTKGLPVTSSWTSSSSSSCVIPKSSTTPNELKQRTQNVPACVSSDSLANSNHVSKPESSHQECLVFKNDELRRTNNNNMKNATIMIENANMVMPLPILNRDVSSLLLLLQASGIRQQEAPLAAYLKSKQGFLFKNSASVISRNDHLLSQETANVVRPEKSNGREIVEDHDDDSSHARSSEGFNNDDCQDQGGELSFRAYQAENWTEKFEELIEFRAQHGHCNVPNSFPENVNLAQWVKRQRYQYKLKLENKRSTMSDERAQALEEIGFVWDSHRAVWDERLQGLLEYKARNGHCNVPSRYAANRQLAIWVKRQRRQYKFYTEQKPSSMTPERIQRLESIGFEWDLRKRNDDDDDLE